MYADCDHLHRLTLWIIVSWRDTRPNCRNEFTVQVQLRYDNISELLINNIFKLPVILLEHLHMASQWPYWCSQTKISLLGEIFCYCLRTPISPLWQRSISFVYKQRNVQKKLAMIALHDIDLHHNILDLSSRSLWSNDSMMQFRNLNQIIIFSSWKLQPFWM